MAKEDIITKALLWSCIEEYTGLFEHIWELNTLFPQNELKKNQALAIETIKHLYKAEMINFFYDTWGENKPLKKINDKEVINKIFTDSMFWEPPAIGEKYIATSATSKGEEYYSKLRHLVHQKYE